MKIGNNYLIDNMLVTVVDREKTRVYFDKAHKEFYLPNNGIGILVFNKLVREGKIVFQKKLSEMKIGQHFWANYNGLLAVFVKTGEDDYSVCGDWEGSFSEESFAFIENISEPKGFENIKKYYER